MFGTLVIQLPSNYSGGKLIVYHQGKKFEFDYSGLDCCSNCYFTSFYANCQHEVEKVTKGYRLCLIYNLMYQGLDECPTPADNQAQVSAIVSAMKKWQEDIELDDCPEMMTYLLEHKYCEASLSFRLLKNGDRAVADVLIQAKAEVDFDLYMGNVNIREEWTAEYRGYGSCEEVSAGEHMDESVCGEHLVSSDGKDTISSIDLNRDSFVPEDFFDTIDPDEEKIEEATGNAGATLDKQYNWAALFLWPFKQDIPIGLSEMIRLFTQDAKAQKDDLVDSANDIMKQARCEGLSVDLSLSFLHALKKIGNSKLIAELLDIIASSVKYSIIENSTFCSLIMSIGHKHGWDILNSPLQAMFTKCSSDNVNKYCTSLKNLLASKKLGSGRNLCQNLLSVIIKFLNDEQDATHIDSSTLYSSNYKGYGYVSQVVVYRSKEFISQLFNLLADVGSKDLIASATSALCSKPIRYPVLETLGPAIIHFCKSAGVEKFRPMEVILTYCISQLEASVRRVIKMPTTSARPVNFTCSCKDCAELIRFLKHPTETQQQFKIALQRRKHLHEQLDSTRADVTHRTETTEIPHILIITKTNASYENDIKKRQQEQALLASLQPLLSVKGRPSTVEPSAKRQKTTGNTTCAVSSSHTTGSVSAAQDASS